MSDRVLKALGTRIRDRRTACHLSQEELAARANLHRTYVGGIERGERNVSVRNLAAIAKALRVPIAALFQGGPQ